MAASVAKCDIIYFTFFDEKLKIELSKIYSVIKDKPISEIYSLLTSFQSDNTNFIDYITAK